MIYLANLSGNIFKKWPSSSHFIGSPCNKAQKSTLNADLSHIPYLISLKLLLTNEGREPRIIILRKKEKWSFPCVSFNKLKSQRFSNRKRVFCQIGRKFAKLNSQNYFELNYKQLSRRNSIMGSLIKKIVSSLRTSLWSLVLKRTETFVASRFSMLLAKVYACKIIQNW